MKYHTSVLLKPSSSRCNLNCSYCFYLKKQEVYPWSDHPSLSLETFELFLKQYIPLSSPHLTFQWQGGEPTLMGLQFFESAMKLERQVATQTGDGNSPLTQNVIQTNAVLLNDQWARFFKKWKFLVGVSIDGPPEWHNQYRTDLQSRGTHSAVMEGVQHLKRYKIPFNVLAVINRINVDKPRELLNWMIEQGFTHLQFIPCAELQAGGDSATENSITPESVTQKQYGQFLVELLDAWLEIGVERVRIRWFDNLLQMLCGYPSELCQLAPNCGYIVLEHNGDCYPCDFQVDNEWFLGNIHETPLDAIVSGEKFERFSSLKNKLHPDCLECPWKTLCYGECPSYRIMNTGQAEYSLPYFCSSYKKFFGTCYDRLESAAVEAAENRGLRVPRESLSPGERTNTQPLLISQILDVAKKNKVGRNGSCPCGSGLKFKRCCAVFRP
ncbi:MAG: anaerobic sulfatase maturase [Candidatus Poribacteria bacterium]|nr:anaerobic sulfatase maturase [Candidatus Poribacteria bacterium]